MATTIINLSSLNGKNGFRLDGVAEGDTSGTSVSNAGDVNDDGFDDVIIGAIAVDSNGESSGSSYVIFGKATGFNATFNLFNLNGSNGFRLDGAAEFDESGWSVSSAGDVNGDGFGDVIIGVPRADTNGSDSGSSYVVFGKASGFSAVQDLDSLDGTNGFRLDGMAENERSGNSVSDSGDVNGDGFDDLIIGAYQASGLNGSNSGSSYVVFGKATGFGATLDLASLNGNNGFRLDGAVSGDFSGKSVSNAGDVNGDGFDDVLVGASEAGPNGPFSGSSYVMFGKASGFDAVLNLSNLDGNKGFRLDEPSGFNLSGYSVSNAGDVNGDSFDDVIIAAPAASLNDPYSGSSYVVFGKASGFDAAMNLSSLDGSNGFRLDGETNDSSGNSVSSAGDINGDGFSDLLVSADFASPNGGESGSTYVVFGKASGFGATLELSSLDNNSGFRLDGVAAFDNSGSSVSGAGDMNSDGFDDLVVSAPSADPNSITDAGSTYVMFGRSDFSGVIKGTPRNDVLKGTQGNDTFEAGGGNDTIFGYGGADVIKAGVGNDTLNGGAGNDTLMGGTGADTMIGAWGNDSYIVDNIRDKVIEKVNEGKDNVTSNITYTLPANIENLTLIGQAKINATGNGLANLIIGNKASNQLKGGAGNDVLDGGLGFNNLTGGTGNDIFKFTTRGHTDKITDYNVSNDTIQLDNAVFKSLSTEGTLAANQFKVGTKAMDANDFIIYNKTAGTLLYDSDGNGGTTATQIAIIGGGLSLTHADIVVI